MNSHPVVSFLLRNAYRILVLLSIPNLVPTLSAVQEINASFGGYYLVLHILTLPVFAVYSGKIGLWAVERIFLMLASLLMVVVYAQVAFPFFRELPKAYIDARAPRFRILYANLLYDADTSDARLPELIARYDPDVVALLEFTEAWGAALRLGSRYPFVKEVPRSDAFGLAFYSRFPFNEGQRETGKGLPEALNAKLILSDKRIVQFDLVHALPPMNNEAWYLNKLVLRRIATQYRQEKSGNFILLADLNATPFSRFARYFLVGAKMSSAMYAHGMQRTWRADSIWMYLDIDHILYRGDLTVTDFHVLPAFGSDHYPLLADFAFTLQESATDSVR